MSKTGEKKRLRFTVLEGPDYLQVYLPKQAEEKEKHRVEFVWGANTRFKLSGFVERFERRRTAPGETALAVLLTLRPAVWVGLRRITFAWIFFDANGSPVFWEEADESDLFGPD